MRGSSWTHRGRKEDKRKEVFICWEKQRDGKEEERGRVGEKEEDILEARTEEEKGMEAKEMERGKGRDSKGRVGRVGRRGTQRWNARREKKREEREEKERKERGKEHFLERAICMENGDIQPNIAPKARAKKEEE